MKARVPLMITFVVTGLVLPIIVRWGADLRSLAIFAALGVVPFIILALFTKAHLRRGESARMRIRIGAILIAYAALIGLTLWIFRRETAPGVTFAIMMLPLYGAIVAPIAYGIGRMIFRK